MQIMPKAKAQKRNPSRRGCGRWAEGRTRWVKWHRHLLKACGWLRPPLDYSPCNFNGYL